MQIIKRDRIKQGHLDELRVNQKVKICRSFFWITHKIFYLIKNIQPKASKSFYVDGVHKLQCLM